MKILYINNYRDGTGWSQAGIGYILALDAAGVDVVPRHIKLNQTQGEVPERISELEARSADGCDVVIQHTLPPMMRYDGNYKRNIGLYVTETSNFLQSGWTQHLNCMDSLVVPCWDCLDCAKNSGVYKPTHIVPHAVDITKYDKKYELLEIPQIDDCFIFYFIGEVIKRKNLPALLKAFHTEFHKNENVALIIKGNVPGLSQQEGERHILEMCKTIKEGLKIYKSESDYHREIIVGNYLTSDQMMQLHATADCFVNTSYGEAFSLVTLDAIGMGNTVISNNCGGMKEFILDKNTGLLCSNVKEPVFAAIDTFEGLHTGCDDWHSINIRDLRRKMRRVFEDEKLRAKLSVNGKEKAKEYSYDKIGKIFKQKLEEICQ